MAIEDREKLDAGLTQEPREAADCGADACPEGGAPAKPKPRAAKRTKGKKDGGAARASEETENPAEQPELNEIFSRLDSLLAQMEEETGLERSFALYEEGIRLLKAANGSIDRVEKQVKVLDDEGIL